MIKKKNKNNIKSKNSMLFILVVSMSIISLLIIISQNSSAITPLPTEFYGLIRYYNFNASAGGVIRAYDADNVLCGSFTIVNSGFYGTLTCRGDDPETTADEGSAVGESISFRYQGGFVTIQGNNTWDYGVFQYVNLTYPVVFCGDNFCDVWYETNYTCPEDCPTLNGSINGTTNGSINVTPDDGGGGGGGTGGGGAEAGGSDSISIRDSTSAFGGTPFNTGFNFTGGLEGFGFECTESWKCGNWSKCNINSLQNRTCEDLNNCGTYEDRPSEVQACIYTPTCFDGEQNGLEEGIDCGGLCPPCLTCFDNIQNCHDGLCEEGIDCGGPCNPCPSCFDGIKNCHDGLCEEGIDCEGPCDKICPKIEAPRPLFVCKKDFNPFSNKSIYFFLLLLLLILGDVIYTYHKIKEIEDNKKLSKLKRAKDIFSIKRKMYLFILIAIILSIILYLYYYFFVMCEIHYAFLWILILILFLAPLGIHELIKHYEYSEHKKIDKLRELLDNHYKQINNLIDIENEHLVELEEDIAENLHNLLSKQEFSEENSKENKNNEEDELLKKISKEIVSLYTRYKEKDNPVESEKILCDDIYLLLQNKKYKDAIDNNLILSSIINKLKILYKQYEEKQNLYDELDKIEESKIELKESEDSEESEEDEEDEESEENLAVGNEELIKAEEEDSQENQGKKEKTKKEKTEKKEIEKE